MLILNDNNLEEVLAKSDKPVLVDFFTNWCFPCFVLGPVLEKIAKNYEEKIIFAKVNLDEAPLMAQKYGVFQIPTVLLFKNGKPLSGFIGVRPEEIIRTWLRQNLDFGKV